MLRLLTLLLFVGLVAGCDAADPFAASADATATRAASPADDASALAGLKIRARGPIEAISATTVTIGGTTFTVSSTTIVLDRNRAPIPFSSLAVGMNAQAEGRQRPDGTVAAKKIKLEDGPDEGIEIERRGAIQAIDGSSLTVADQVFTFTGTTRWLDRRGNPVSPSAFTVGMLIEAEGHLQADGTATAKKVKMED